jgi:hypothetical protein
MHTSTADWPWVGKNVGYPDVRVVAYHLSATVVSALVIYPDGTAQPEVLDPQILTVTRSGTSPLLNYFLPSDRGWS